MRVLTIDIGTGTQDILLFEGDKAIENCVKMVMPSPTLLVAEEIRRATARGEALLLTGHTMGGGPCAWAAQEHIAQGLPLYATADAARTFDDDLEMVKAMGVTILEGDGAQSISARRIFLRDLRYRELCQALEAMGVDNAFDAVAVAVFDHGAAPPGFSDRLFRFQYISERLGSGEGFAAFAYMRGEIPARLTRFQAVADSFPGTQPLMLADTGPAAILGCLEDPRVRSEESAVLVNVGNFHTLAFHLSGGRVVGLCEHHTGLLTQEKLEGLLLRLASGEITNDEVFADNGHGALVFSRDVPKPVFYAVTGPRRELLRNSSLKVHFAVPHGDMMLAGCFGLLRSLASKMPLLAPEIERALGPAPAC